jgi:hypothetical protein
MGGCPAAIRSHHRRLKTVTYGVNLSRLSKSATGFGVVLSVLRHDTEDMPCDVTHHVLLNGQSGHLFNLRELSDRRDGRRVRQRRVHRQSLQRDRF